jgi:hypothetical protein
MDGPSGSARTQNLPITSSTTDSSFNKMYKCMNRVTTVISLPTRRCWTPNLGLYVTWRLHIYRLMSRSRIFLLHGDVTIAGEGLHNLGLCSALRVFERGGILIVPHLLWHGTSVSRSHPKDRPIQSPHTTHKGMWRIYCNPNLHGSPYKWKIHIHIN